MTTLLLVRHGQASFGSGDYNRLCAAGEHQAAVLGRHLRAAGRLPRAAVSGALRRQGETARLALEAAAHPLPVAVDPAFDEYPSDALFAAYLPVLAAARSEFTGGVEALRSDRRRFQAALMAVMDLWLAAHPGFPGETREAFHTRVRAGLERAVEGRDKDDVIAVFTSGGVIGAAVGVALGLAPQAAVALSWRVHNASLTELHYGRSGFSLTGFNETAHLRLTGDPALLTHR